jgi:RNA polymerase sigma factor (sigma-70 family)
VAVDERDLVATLVARAQAGDRDAMRELLLVAKPVVDRVVAPRLRQRPQDADDAVQAALIAIFTGFATYDPGRAPFLAWAALLARRAVSDLLRGTDRRRHREDAYGRADDAAARRTQAVTPEEQAAFEADFREALGHVPSPERRFLAWAYVFDGATPADLERALPDRRHMVRRWLNKDLATIFELLGDDAADDPSEGGTP